MTHQLAMTVAEAPLCIGFHGRYDRLPRDMQ